MGSAASTRRSAEEGDVSSSPSVSAPDSPLRLERKEEEAEEAEEEERIEKKREEKDIDFSLPLSPWERPLNDEGNRRCTAVLHPPEEEYVLDFKRIEDRQKVKEEWRLRIFRSFLLSFFRSFVRAAAVCYAVG
jgi:hypothetical protein